MAKNNPTKRWQLSLSRTNFVAVMGLLICMLGLCMLPNFSKFTDTEIFGTFLGGLLCGQGYFVLMLVSILTNRDSLSALLRSLAISSNTQALTNKETTHV